MADQALRSRPARVAAVLAAVVVLVALVVWLVLAGRDGTDPDAADPAPATTATTSTAAAPARPPDGCGDPTSRPFRPSRIAIEGVIQVAEVRPLPRDSRGVPGVPPISDKDVFAWDDGGIEPGSRRGNVLLNTHTWPDGTAVGNVMLRELHRGDEIILGGSGHELCYRVTKRVEVLAADGYPPYYDTDGPPQVAIVVCSGERTGPGEWTNRTLWFARPVR